MIFHRMTAASHRLGLIFTVLFLAGLIPLTTGCSSVNKITSKTKRFTKTTVRKVKKIGRLEFSDKGVKRRIVIGPVVDKTTFETKDFGVALHTGLVENLTGKCGGNIFIHAGNPAYPEKLDSLPMDATGRIDNFELARMGRQLGLNAVISGTVIDIRQYAEERGMIFWRGTRNLLQVLVNVEVLDMATAAKLVDESYMYETELDNKDIDDLAMDEKDLIPIIDKAIAEAVQYLKNEICDAVRDQPWTGFVTSVAGSTVEISSGSEVGLASGRVLEVFDKGAVLNGAYGERFFMPGKKIGEIKITSVQGDKSTASSEAGLTIVPDSQVRPK